MPKVITETNEVIAIDKPAGLIVHSDGRTIESSLAEWVIARYPAQAAIGEPWISPQGESVRVGGIVHRLDRTTSGILLAAKTPEMWAYLKGEFKARRVEKAYRAFVYGHVEGDVGRIVAEIARTKEPPKRWYARPCDESDKRAAITEWRVIRRFAASGDENRENSEPITELELHPKTGRTHQIRVHLASIGHPILADHLYVPDKPRLGFARPALHAENITAVINGAPHTFTAPLPADFIDFQ